jgi:hypothetical protein
MSNLMNDATGVSWTSAAPGVFSMSQCPYINLLDPDLYGAGNHLPKLQELREQADAPIIKIEDPLRQKRLRVITTPLKDMPKK